MRYAPLSLNYASCCSSASLFFARSLTRIERELSVIVRQNSFGRENVSSHTCRWRTINVKKKKTKNEKNSSGMCFLSQWANWDLKYGYGCSREDTRDERENSNGTSIWLSEKIASMFRLVLRAIFCFNKSIFIRSPVDRIFKCLQRRRTHRQWGRPRIFQLWEKERLCERKKRK